MNKKNHLDALIRMGMKVFICHGIVDGKCTCGEQLDGHPEAGKHPTGAWRGPETIQGSQLLEKLDNNKDLNLAIDCLESNLLVVDVDPRNGGDESLARLIDHLEGEFPETVVVQTGIQSRGRGRHYYFHVNAGMKLKNRLSAYPGIDFKHNGYVLAAGSKHASGIEYEYLHAHGIEEFAIQDAPSALLALLGYEKRLPKFAVSLPLVRATETSNYGRAALDDECSKIASTPEGGRNNQLFNSAIRIGELVGGGEIPEDVALRELEIAASYCGLTNEEFNNVVTRPGGAFDIGLGSPRSTLKVSAQEISWAETRAYEGPHETSEFIENLNVVDWEDAFSTTFEEPWLVPGLLSRIRATSIYSAPGVGKSLLALELSACLATGRAPLDLVSNPPMKVLYLDFENSLEGDIVPRLKEMGFVGEELSNLTYLSFPMIAAFDTPQGGVDFEHILSHFNPEFVVIDTVSRTISMSENENSTWLAFYKNVGIAIKRRKIGYLRLDHTGKNEDAGQRGGSAKSGDLDIIWSMKATSLPGLFSLTNEKSRANIPSKALNLDRKNSPLRHEIASNRVDWVKIIRNLDRIKEALDICLRHFDAKGAVVGQKQTWDDKNAEFSRHGISKDQATQGHRLARKVQAGQLSYDASTGQLPIDWDSVTDDSEVND